MKKLYHYKSGREVIELEKLTCNDYEKLSYLHRLNSYTTLVPPDTTDDEQEIDYTEDRAKFFVDLLNSICQLNERIKEHLSPESIVSIIENKQKLLG